MIYALFAAILAGAALGWGLLDVEAKPVLDDILMGALDFMVLVAGIEIGSNRHLLKRICSAQSLLLAVSLPAATVAGSLGGAYLSHFVTGLSAYDSLLVASGLGWYSLSSVVISTMHSTELGAIAFLSNMLREVSSFVLIPLLASRHGLLCIAPGGAGTMDSLLPLVIKAAGMQAGIFSFINGLILSLLVPLLLSLLLGG